MCVSAPLGMAWRPWRTWRGSGQSYLPYRGALQTTVHQSLAWASQPFWGLEPGCHFRCPTVALATVAVTSPAVASCVAGGVSAPSTAGGA